MRYFWRMGSKRTIDRVGAAQVRALLTLADPPRGSRCGDGLVAIKPVSLAGWTPSAVARVTELQARALVARGLVETAWEGVPPFTLARLSIAGRAWVAGYQHGQVDGQVDGPPLTKVEQQRTARWRDMAKAARVNKKVRTSVATQGS